MFKYIHGNYNICQKICMKLRRSYDIYVSDSMEKNFNVKILFQCLQKLISLYFLHLLCQYWSIEWNNKKLLPFDESLNGKYETVNDLHFSRYD